MPITLMDVCNKLRDCAEKLEEEIRTNINECHNMVTGGFASDVKLAIEKAKDFHYKEITRFLNEILTDIRKILVHEETIRKLSDKESLSDEELRRYSYVQRQVSNFGGAIVTKREKRRVASEVSLCSLEAWEQYLDKKEEEDSTIAPTNLDYNTVPKRSNNRRKQKKFVSSTFNNFLEQTDTTKSLELISEEDRTNETSNLSNGENSCADLKKNGATLERKEIHPDGLNDLRSSFVDDNEENDVKITRNASDNYEEKQTAKFPIFELVKSLSEEHLLDPVDSKPKIVHVVYKKNND